jgi:hypothetical protein
MGFHKLESFQDAKGFRDAAAEWEVVDDAVADDAGLVNQEQAAKCDSGSLEQNAILFGDFLVQVGNQRIGYAAEAAFLAGEVVPGEVTEHAIDRTAKNDGITLGELFEVLLESDDFGGANEGEVEGVKEKDDILATELTKMHFGDLVFNDGLS